MLYGYLAQNGEEEMKIRKFIAASAVTAGVCVAMLTAPMANAEPVANSLIAQDDAPAPLAPSTVVVGVDADIPSGLTVRGAADKVISVQGAGEKTRTGKAIKPGSPVVFNKLTPGKVYTVLIGGKRIGTATPVAAPSPAWGLTVSTTGQLGTVALEWKHQVTKAQGKVSYQVTATPQVINARSLPSPKAVTAQVAAMSWTLENLDPAVLYTFSVTPVNSAATGAATTAAMSRTLGEIFGTGQVTSDPAPALPATQAPAPAPVPASVPAPAPGPVAPTTRTIYVCPDAYTETGSGVCEKTSAYTYTSIGYTYHSEPNYVQVQIGTTERSHPFDGNACGWGTLYGNTCYEYTAVYETRQQGTNQVKDTTPAGYTDTGSTWSKKDAMPTGYTDNGSAWVQTTAKVAKIVPA